MRIHALLFLLFTQSAFALYGGKAVAPQRYLVELSVSGQSFCQGTVIAPNKVLTTGHCIQGMGLRLKDTSLLLTYYPEVVTITQGAQKVRAKRIDLAPSYFDSPGLEAEDLALIELEAPLKSAVVLPVASKNEIVPGSKLLLASLKEEAETSFRKKLSGPDSTIIMTDGSHAGVCQGDSGGTLVLEKNGKKFIAGILSAQAEGCARRHSISYFPRTKF
ncbi:MAG: trypsin-like serine protease [Bacteriovoracaceae bacterium]